MAEEGNTYLKPPRPTAPQDQTETAVQVELAKPEDAAPMSSSDNGPQKKDRTEMPDNTAQKQDTRFKPGQSGNRQVDRKEVATKSVRSCLRRLRVTLMPTAKT